MISDVVKPHSKQAISELKKNGIQSTVMLTGDKKSVAEGVASELGIDRVFSELLPQDKVSKIEELIAAKHSDKERVVFVGDGLIRLCELRALERTPR